LKRFFITEYTEHTESSADEKNGEESSKGWKNFDRENSEWTRIFQCLEELLTGLQDQHGFFPRFGRISTTEYTENTESSKVCKLPTTAEGRDWHEATATNESERQSHK